MYGTRETGGGVSDGEEEPPEGVASPLLLAGSGLVVEALETGCDCRWNGSRMFK